MGSESLLNQADSMWKILDDMAESDPEAYKRFIDKALKEGATYFKPPEPCFCISTILVSMATRTRVTRGVPTRNFPKGIPCSVFE